MSLQTALQLLGGVGIFLFAIKLLSESLQSFADNNLRAIIARVTRTPLLGVLVGGLATVLLQSSSATTVMTISFVDAGLMTLKQAVGIVMGANIGTTVTGQIVAFKVKDFAYVFIIVGILLNLVTKSQAKKDLGIGILAFGLLFIGMQTMENAMYFLRDRKDIFLMFADNHLLGLLAGAGLTLLVQSSSATMGITIALAAQNLLSLEAAISIVLGVNVGTTITAIIAALGTSRAAQQTSAAHVLFNLVAVVIFYPLIPLYIPFVEMTTSSIPHQVANAHTILNIINTLIFLPFVKPFTKLIRFILPDEKQVEKVKISNLDLQLIQTSPIDAVETLKNECNHMAKITLKQLNALEEILFNNNKELLDYMKASEKELDILYEDINEYASKLMQIDLPDKMKKNIYKHLSFASDLERIGDKTSQLILFHNKKLANKGEFSENLNKAFFQIFTDAHQAYKLSYFLLSGEMSEDTDKKKIKSIKNDVYTISRKVKKDSYKALLLPELHDNSAENHIDVQLEYVFVESIRIMERIANRANGWVN